KDVGIKNIDNIKKYLEQYVYSSYLDYIGVSRGESDILHKEAFPEYFQDYHDFEFFIEEWLNYKNSPLL
ncbi:MAG: hypothetical protein KAS07_00115, partial [Candidatus Pacebacteria bacterium]|nr:hypothetical protein [Candidatus Paceibacterota bacterium]